MRHFAYWTDQQNGAGGLLIQAISSSERTTKPAVILQYANNNSKARAQHSFGCCLCSFHSRLYNFGEASRNNSYTDGSD